MQPQFTFILYYTALFISIFFLSKYIYQGYIRFVKKFNVLKTILLAPSKKIKISHSTGIIFAITLLVSSVSLENLDFVDFKNISPEIGTSILIAFFGVYKDFLNVTNFQKYILITFLISMLVYSSSLDNAIIDNLNGFLGIYALSYFESVFITFLSYILIINTFSHMDSLNGYVIIFCIIFFLSLNLNHPHED